MENTKTSFSFFFSFTLLTHLRKCGESQLLQFSDRWNEIHSRHWSRILLNLDAPLLDQMTRTENQSCLARKELTQ
jgi:hypothetical protein